MTAKVEAKVEDFKSALHESLSDLPPGRTVKQLADIAGVSYSTLWECADTEKVGWISVRRLIRIIPSLSNLAVLDYLERIAGRIAFRIPDPREVCGEQMGKAIKEFGEFVVEGSQVGWTAERAAQLRREAEEAAAAILHYAHCVEAQAQPARKLEAVGGVR
jgi:predicted transcriptional regulator